MLTDPNYDLVILDELTYMLAFGYLSESEVISTVDGRPGHQSVVITGRGGGAALQDLADTVSEVKDIKHAFNAGVKARKGVDY
jgi:cob(I)alamin adenosyltransferase